MNPSRLFERRWAFTVVAAALERLRQEYELAGKQTLFKKLQPCITRELDDRVQTSASAALDLSEGAARVALHRLRRRFGALLRSEVAYTISDPKDLEDELRHLLASVAGMTAFFPVVMSGRVVATALWAVGRQIS